ncbi:GSCFA domain-containing protein [uncultured Massilia sp.]|uniref:GSCFA domain-containing protein n=1 Tax=uncultured Massilia sp. TaxID=169973 RepID=UPI0025DC506D|nr:GSCFA domain-containing protein [uncultured Massilia sp.]
MHPYSTLPARNFWKKFVSDSPWRDLGLNDRPKFALQPSDRIATAGSCFAQHIARYMARVGMAPYSAEPAHTLLQEFGGDVDSYKLFSARYGNIYTIRQYLELFRQAFGLMPIIEDFVEQDGRWFDLLRPSVQKEGFASLAEARADRAYHLGRVRAMFETADILVFTLGLTESWCHAQHGYTYPVCPGTVRGSYDPALHAFHNFTCTEVVADLEAMIAEVARVNPGARWILTVSPVQLVATNSHNNVLLASSYSKSALRAAAGEVEARHAHVAYFPSYEIINHPASYGQYLSSDLRDVTERGVAHVMDCFLSSYYGIGAAEERVAPAPLQEAAAPVPAPMLPPVECDELMNAPAERR